MILEIAPEVASPTPAFVNAIVAEVLPPPTVVPGDDLLTEVVEVVLNWKVA